MSRAARAEEWTGALAEAGLPINFTYPVLEIAVRELIGLAILAAGISLVSQSGAVQLVAGIAMSLFGGLVAGSNLRALLDQEWRRIVVDRDGVEVRYGFSHRRYPFLDYSEYRISRIGFRRYLTALPLDVERALGQNAARGRVTIFDRPAFICPVPLFDRNAMLALVEWQLLLNDLRRSALASAAMIRA
ncbi:MAG: hypothetical protein HC871_13535 [Rhizobiales bacterium]|nr:hypothetical protein [Hyphomicrobiales bacterium]